MLLFILRGLLPQVPHSWRLKVTKTTSTTCQCNTTFGILWCITKENRVEKKKWNCNCFCDMTTVQAPSVLGNKRCCTSMSAFCVNALHGCKRFTESVVLRTHLSRPLPGHGSAPDWSLRTFLSPPSCSSDQWSVQGSGNATTCAEETEIGGAV